MMKSKEVYQRVRDQLARSSAKDVTHKLRNMHRDGATLDSTDKHKLTALDRAVINGNEDATRVLVKLFSRMAIQRSACWAILCKHHDIFNFLVEQLTAQKDRRALMHDAVWGCCGKLRKPLRVRGTLQEALDDPSTLSAVETAAGGADTFFIKLLIDKTGGVNICDEQDNSKTPLHYASLACDVGCVRMLLEQGASVRARDDWGRTPLLCAPVMLLNTKEGRELRKVITVDDKSINDCLSLLLEYGSDVNVQDEDGSTALHLFAKASSSLDCMKLLLQHGADATIRDQDANTLMDLAYGRIRKELQIILKHPNARLPSEPATPSESEVFSEVRNLQSEVRMLREELSLLKSESLPASRVGSGHTRGALLGAEGETDDDSTDTNKRKRATEEDDRHHRKRSTSADPMRMLVAERGRMSRRGCWSEDRASSSRTPSDMSTSTVGQPVAESQVSFEQWSVSMKDSNESLIDMVTSADDMQAADAVDDLTDALFANTEAVQTTADSNPPDVSTVVGAAAGPATDQETVTGATSAAPSDAAEPHTEVANETRQGRETSVDRPADDTSGQGPAATGVTHGEKTTTKTVKQSAKEKQRLKAEYKTRWPSKKKNDSISATQ